MDGLQGVDDEDNDAPVNEFAEVISDEVCAFALLAARSALAALLGLTLRHLPLLLCRWTPSSIKRTAFFLSSTRAKPCAIRLRMVARASFPRRALTPCLHPLPPARARPCTRRLRMPHDAQALQCVAACMRDRILNGEHDLVGVLLFGTMKHKVPEGQQGFPHIYLVQPLEEPSANSMRELSLICQAEDGDGSAGPATAVADDFGHMDNTDPLDFANVLWVSSMMFNSTASKNMRRRLCTRARGSKAAIIGNLA